METFRGKAHLPGAEKAWNMEISIDWNTREASVHIDEAPDGISDWPALLVQTFGIDEIAFRTKGIPGLFTHWWHFVRGDNDDLAGIVLGLPDYQGVWQTCHLELKKQK
jgi:hypothetical protein